ncbi:MAG: hypothetical protein Q4C98_11755, partial [Capnocytophaga sp.]|nr:hypothetical protein [Capnocytophaga sp.]
NDPKLKLYVFQGQSEGEYTDDDYINKIINRMICERLNGEDEISENYFHKSGKFKHKDLIVDINKDKTINLVSPNITEEKQMKFSSDATSVSKNVKIYSIDFGGVIISSENKKSIDELINKIYPENAKSIQKQYEKRFNELWKKVKDKNNFTETEINILREIVLCTGAKIDPKNRYSVIKKSFEYSTKEKVEDLVLDLLQTTSNDDAKKFLTYLKKDSNLVNKLLDEMDDVVLFLGAEDNAKRLKKELIILYRKAYPKSKYNAEQVINWLLGKLGDESTTYDIVKGLLNKEAEFTIAEINNARKLIEAIKDTTKQKELYLKLQEKVPYYSQRDNESLATEEDIKNNSTWMKIGDTAGDIMCNLTSQAMGLHYLGLEPPCKDCPEECNQYTQMEDYLECVRRGKGFEHRGRVDTRENLSKLFENVSQKQETINSYDKEIITKKLKPYLEKGCSIIISSFGHIVRLQAITEKGLVVDDPYGKVVDFSKSGATPKYKKDGVDYRNSKNLGSSAGNNCLWKWEDLSKNKVSIRYAE